MATPVPVRVRILTNWENQRRWEDRATINDSIKLTWHLRQLQRHDRSHRLSFTAKLRAPTLPDWDYLDWRGWLTGHKTTTSHGHISDKYYASQCSQLQLNARRMSDTGNGATWIQAYKRSITILFVRLSLGPSVTLHSNGWTHHQVFFVI